MASQAKYDALTAKIKPIRDAVDQAVKNALQDEEKALSPLWSEVESYFDTLLAEADAVWKFKILTDAKDRALKFKDNLDGPDMQACEVAAQLANEIESALGWVVPKPVDPAVVAAVIARDRAADMAERAAKGIGIEKG